MNTTRQERLYALTIAGGEGKRLKPLTDKLPKPMVPINGEPLLLHQARMLMSAGVTDIVFLCGYLAENIKNYFGDGTKFGFRAHYSYEEKPLGRGGALRQGCQYVPAEVPFIIGINGDIISNQSFTELIQFHQKRAATATILTVPYPNSYGIVKTDSKNVIKTFAEKVDLPYWINGGIYVMQRDIENLLPKKGDHEDTTFPELAREGKLVAFPSRHYWRAVDNHKDLNDVNQNITRLHFNKSNII